ncbi:IclR family transcriptional regulator domain-containing protein, partial [Escherichia coli]|uniref:IclR family transcriptional regulator domain-containing protein n=1 Tax=Escherichia coli TaxID=562 RepID=UPI0035E3CEE5
DSVPTSKSWIGKKLDVHITDVDKALLTWKTREELGYFLEATQVKQKKNKKKKKKKKIKIKKKKKKKSEKKKENKGKKNNCREKRKNKTINT